MVPEPHVLERRRVGLDVLARQRGVARQLALLDVVEPNARRVAAMLCIMYGVSRTCSFGATTNRCTAEAHASPPNDTSEVEADGEQRATA